MGVTGRVTLSVVAGALPMAILAVLIQLLPATVLVTSSSARTISSGAALNLLFAAHLPWSLWLIGVTTWAAFGGASFSYGATFSLKGMLAAAVPALIWTSFIMAAFCRVVLNTTTSGARIRVAVHQAALWTITLSYIAWSAGGWFQLWIW